MPDTKVDVNKIFTHYSRLGVYRTMIYTLVVFSRICKTSSVKSNYLDELFEYILALPEYTKSGRFVEYIESEESPLLFQIAQIDTFDDAKTEYPAAFIEILKSHSFSLKVFHSLLFHVIELLMSNVYVGRDDDNMYQLLVKFGSMLPADELSFPSIESFLCDNEEIDRWGMPITESEIKKWEVLIFDE